MSLNASMRNASKLLRITHAFCKKRRKGVRIALTPRLNGSVRFSGTFCTSPAIWVCQSLIDGTLVRSEEHTSELQSLMRISYAVFCMQIKKTHIVSHLLHEK